MRGSNRPTAFGADRVTMRVLVLGYSVTAEKQSYVELAAERLKGTHTLHKIGFGGLQPHDARHLFPEIIAAHAPNILILDQATPAFRKFTSDVNEYEKTVLNILRECWTRNIRLSLLDFPRTDVDYDQDWVTTAHRRLCAETSIPHFQVTLDDGFVWDEVHPTDSGRIAYASTLISAIETAKVPQCHESHFVDLPVYSNVRVSDLVDARIPRRAYSRGGYEVDLVDLSPDVDLVIDLPPDTILKSCSALMGPRTGRIDAKLDGRALNFMAHDKFCYYERLGVFPFRDMQHPKGIRTSRLTLSQSSDLPGIELSKGAPNKDPRIGAIGHIFFESPSIAIQKPIKILVFGFSVTGDATGYVERFSECYAAQRPHYSIIKVGLGGMQPDHARHLIPSLVDQFTPDVIVIEFSTASYRDRPSSDFRRGDQRATILSLFSLCRDRSLKCGILDFPLVGVDANDDWMLEVNETQSARFGVPHKVLGLLPGTLTDIVHPNSAGKDRYARALLEILDEICESNPDFSTLGKVRTFHAHRIEDIEIEGGDQRTFNRHGFDVTMQNCPADTLISFKLPKFSALVGLITAMGPRTGTMQIKTPGTEDTIPSYDGFCYYERVIGRTTTKTITQSLSICQLSDIPDTPLHKGQKNTEPRIGSVSHILFEPLSDDQLASFLDRQD